MEGIQIRLTGQQIKELEKRVKNGDFVSKSEAIRHALNQMLINEGVLRPEEISEEFMVKL